MPELPEVETIRLGIKPHLCGAEIDSVTIRSRKLRWPIPDDFEQRVMHQTIQTISRRGKYLCIHLQKDTILIHLGMSGRLSLLMETHPPIQRHDHVDIHFTNGQTLRYTDPRRFGAILLTPKATPHALLANLGVEPLSEDFTIHYILEQAKARKMAIKPFLMNNKVMVGIGNIYATEALFLAKIHPAMPANALTQAQAKQLVAAVKQVLIDAIAQGGTTLKDFLDSKGKPGYFVQQLKAYGRGGQSCVICGTSLQSCVLGQRTTVFCPNCQKIH